ncbi:MAG: putative polymerase subfamily sigma factor [Ilumatobacteraceae bacterium]|nr:putative polymerase subfamily sigma factor [Ilumatobacteraceae bacterium]
MFVGHELSYHIVARPRPDAGERLPDRAWSPIYDGRVPPTATIDRATVERFRAGDEAAVRTIYRAYSGVVWGVAMRVLRDRSLADEATQQSFLQAWRHAAGFEPDRDLAPWLVTIAKRVAIDIYRREQRRPTSAMDDAATNHPSLVTMPPDVEQAWEVAQVRLAIGTLGADEQQIVRMQHLDGLTHSEISERLGLALGTVKSRSFRAHKTLAARLAHLRCAEPGTAEPNTPRRRTGSGEERVP